jgi:uncharacterized Fe-S cluster-containing radical SAM superfamily protein
MTLINNFNADEKILKYIDKIENYLHGSETLISFELDLTNICNSLCPKCTGKKIDQSFLSLPQLMSIISQMKDLNVKSVVISGGGEPLCSEHFTTALELFYKANIKVGLNTNGILLANNEVFVGSILNYCEYCRISLDAGSPEMYEVTHGLDDDDYYKVLSGIKMLMNRKNRYGSLCSIGTGYLTGQETLNGAMNFFKVSNDLNVDFAQLRPFTGEWINVDDYTKIGKILYPKLIIRSSSHKYCHMNDEVMRPYNTCHGMYFNTVITADYKMWVCLHHRQNPKYLLGDLNKQSIKEILRSDRMREVQQLVPNDTDCPLFCRNDAINRTLMGVCCSNDIAHKEFL